MNGGVFFLLMLSIALISLVLLTLGYVKIGSAALGVVILMPSFVIAKMNSWKGF
jgi:hypothetical protein